MVRRDTDAACADAPAPLQPHRPEKRVPVRTCVGCRGRAAKHELLRVVAGAGTQGRTLVVPDPGGTAPGRGAHLHATVECYDLAVRRRAFGRALRVPGAVVTDALAEHLAQPDADPTDAGPRRSWSSSS